MRLLCLLVLVALVGCRGEAPTPEAKPAAKAPAVDSGLNRPIPGTDWERERDLVGRVRKVSTYQTHEYEGKKVTRSAVIEFNRFGQMVRTWHEGELSEDAKLDDAGNVVERVTIPKHPGSPAWTTQNLAFDDAGRILERRLSIPATGSSSAIDIATTYTYDARGHVLSERRVHLLESGGTTERETTYTYDEDGDWLTRNEDGDVETREVVSLDAQGRKALRTVKGPELILTETFDQETGRLLSNEVSISESKLVYHYDGFDEQGNWLKVSVNREFPDGKLDWVADVERTLEYFD